MYLYLNCFYICIMSVLVQEKKPELKVESVIVERPKDTVQSTDMQPEPQQILFRTPVLYKKNGDGIKSFIKSVKKQNRKSTAEFLSYSLGMAMGGCMGAGLGLFVAAQGSPNISMKMRSRRNIDVEELEYQVTRWELAQRILDGIGEVRFTNGRQIFDESITMPIHQIRLSIAEMKQKFGLEWITFRDAVPVWSIIIDNLFRDGKVGIMNTQEQLANLGNGSMCIMGEADNNDSYNRYENQWSHCGGCSYLATDGLKLFSSYGWSGNGTYLTSEQGWQEYKDRFEYHWNVFHR